MVTNNAINLKSNGIAYYNGAGIFTALSAPLTVSYGCTGRTTLTAYRPLCGGTSSTGNLQSLASDGTLNQRLVHKGAAALPAYEGGKFGYILYTQSDTGNPADNSTLYVATGASYTSVTSRHANAELIIPLAGTIKSCYGQYSVAGTLGSSGSTTVSLRLNDTTDTTVTSSLASTSAYQAFSNTGLSISVSAGDTISVKVANPAWTTNPTTVAMCATIFIEPT